MNPATPMPSQSFIRSLSGLVRLALLLLGGMALLLVSVEAYPPAPHHTLHGVLRDEYGTPIDLTGTEIILETSSGIRIKTLVNPGIETGSNYRLEVPMDAGLLSSAYQPTALRPTVPFRIRVKVGGATYLPIEMKGDYAKLGKPSERTRLNLTLGEDSDGDLLPDAWERLVNPDISQVHPNGDAGNGMTYLDTYYVGTYVVDPKQGFTLEMRGIQQGAAQLQFLAVTGRAYVVEGSSDLKSWQPVSFRVKSEGGTAPLRRTFQTSTIKPIDIEVPGNQSDQPLSYFRLILQ